MRGRCAALISFFLLAHAAWLAAAVPASPHPLERKVHASQAVLEKRLHALQGYPGGRLPILDGFVEAGTQPLARFSRAYYQYAVQMTPAGEGATLVRVTAKITAWFAGGDTAHSGYQVLTSNGRLEEDLFEQLDESPSGAARASLPTGAAAADLPSAPSESAREVFTNPHNAVPAPSRPAAGSPADTANAKHTEELQQQVNTLEQVLKNQAHPDNLAVVKSSNTPLLARPVEGSQVVLNADAEDEFQILEMEGDWVHVMISGLSRGWVRRSYVELPAKFDPAEQSLNLLQTNKEPAFRLVRDETGTFPGDWEPLRGKTVKIVWVQPTRAEADPSADNERLAFAGTVFRKAYKDMGEKAGALAGVVVVFDSKDGGIAAATLPVLQQWAAGHLPDAAFWKRCWLDPAEAFK